MWSLHGLFATAGMYEWVCRRRYTGRVNTFTERELKFVNKLRQSPVDTTLELPEPCPNHSVCTPLPVFRVHRDSEETFTAEWNDWHRKGPRQSFRFDAITEGGS